MSKALETPVALFFFNRPDVTQKVFAEIRRAQPKKLFLIADGPRPHQEGEISKCAQAREVVSQIDWDCEVLRNFSERNLGCKNRMISGINWVFENAEEAIIFEDDCLPDPSFFPFCQELLARYRDTPEIMMIGGSNVLTHFEPPATSYLISTLPMTWGWATWRRAWKAFDVNMSGWPEFRKKSAFRKLIPHPVARFLWSRHFQRAYSGKFKTVWDYQWTFSIWKNGGKTILSTRNLISNIGFGAAATHTQQSHPFANLRLEKADFPLVHPSNLEVNQAATLAYFRNEARLWPKIKRALQKHLRISV